MFARAVKSLNAATQRRCFTIFAGAESKQVVYTAGKLTREIDGKKVSFNVATEFDVIPKIRTVVNTTYRGETEASQPDYLYKLYLINEKGDAADVKTVSVEEYLGDSTAQLVGPAYKWTSAKIAEKGLDGSKTETEYTFGDKDVKVAIKATTKDGKTIKDSGSLKVVSRADFDAAKDVIEKQIFMLDGARIAKTMAELRAAESTL